jgi:hypothetical protein
MMQLYYLLRRILARNTVCFIVAIIRDIEDEEFGYLEPSQLAVSSFNWIE